jgi:hypothetical protein
MSATSGFACGPTMNPSGNNMPQERERWTRHRLEELKRQELRQDRELRKIERERTADRVNDAFEFRDPLRITHADREYDNIMRQREIDRIEALSIKKERGELTHEEARKLKALIRDVRNHGH